MLKPKVSSVFPEGGFDELRIGINHCGLFRDGSFLRCHPHTLLPVDPQSDPGESALMFTPSAYPPARLL